jgi:hypothetical protein
LRQEQRVWRRGAAPSFVLAVGCDWDVTKRAVRKRKGTGKKPIAKQRGSEMEQSGSEEVKCNATQLAVETPKKKRPVRSIERHTDVEFRREFREVFDGLVEKAKQGGTAQTRLLLQLGNFGEQKSGKRRKGTSLSAMLLSELKRRQDERESAEKASGSEAIQMRADGEGATSGGNVEQE